MSDAIPHQFPANAWLTYAEAAKRWGKSSNPMHVEYRRADLAPTLSAAMELPEVRALLEAMERIAHASDIYGVEANAEDQGAETLAYAHKSTCNLARAALAHFAEAKP